MFAVMSMIPPRETAPPELARELNLRIFPAIGFAPPADLGRIVFLPSKLL
jgi:hypothetical protein